MLKVITTGPALTGPTGSEFVLSVAPAGLAERLYQGTEILGNAQMRTLLHELAHQFDVVLLDTPALSTATDAAILVPVVDEILLVVAQDQANLGGVRSVRDQLAKLNAKSVHIVVNRAT